MVVVLVRCARMPAMRLNANAVVQPFIRQSPRTLGSKRWNSSASMPELVNVEQLLEKATWSVESLLPSNQGVTETPKISSKQLHHLLRLSALPSPKSAEDEAAMLKTLSAQLHFVNDIRKVDTTGVKPLQSLRDETAVGQKEEEIGMEELKEAFAQEEIKGSYHKKIRRRQEMPIDKEGSEVWDVLGSAQKKVGRYFVVEGGKTGAE